MNHAAFSDNDSEIARRLHRHPSFRGGKLRLQRHEKRIVLQGSVPTWYDKQLAQELIRRLDDVEEVVNDLVVDGDATDRPSSLPPR